MDDDSPFGFETEEECEAALVGEWHYVKTINIPDWVLNCGRCEIINGDVEYIHEVFTIDDIAPFVLQLDGDRSYQSEVYGDNRYKYINDKLSMQDGYWYITFCSEPINRNYYQLSLTGSADYDYVLLDYKENSMTLRSDRYDWTFLMER